MILGGRSIRLLPRILPATCSPRLVNVIRKLPFPWQLLVFREFILRDRRAQAQFNRAGKVRM